MILFGLFLIFTGIRMAVQKEQNINPDDSLVIRWVRRFFPVTAEFHGSTFLVTIDGIRHITPLMVVLLFLETTDLLFAVDSVPAVFGVTREPFVVYTSNVFAMLGLRAMFFLLAGAMDRFYVLKHGLALVLVFVGLKMVWLDHLFGGRFPIGVSLGIISSVIAASILLSLVFPKAEDRARAANRRGVRVARPAAGVLFLLLAVIGFLYAAGPGHSLLPLPALDGTGRRTPSIGRPHATWSAPCSCWAEQRYGNGLEVPPLEKQSGVDAKELAEFSRLRCADVSLPGQRSPPRNSRRLDCCMER